MRFTALHYWSLVKGDSLPPGVSYVVFDGTVNSGVGQSVKWLQRALGIAADGIVGPQTLNAVPGVFETFSAFDIEEVDCTYSMASAGPNKAVKEVIISG